MNILTAATANHHKVHEIASKLSGSGITIIPYSVIRNAPDIVEDGHSFLENSLIKARAIADIFSTAVIADDSGLVVDALGGEPGIRSARYLDLPDDRARYEAILEKMRDVPPAERTARFVCAITIIAADGTIHQTEGKCEGLIAAGPSGAQGFGYDPVFFLPQFNMTMAEISLAEKNSVSHRGRALDAAADILRSLFPA
jgi:XTP/dITP diphosphohydrolase